MNAWIVFFGGFCLGFGSILAIGAYVYFRDFHKSSYLTTEGINSDVKRALSSEISVEDEKQIAMQEDTRSPRQ